MADDFQYDVFLSHSSKDKAVVRGIAERLRKDGLGVWFTVQVSPHSRIAEVVFERAGARPTDEECQAWLRELLPGQEPVEAPGLPGATVRRFEVFDHRPEVEAPLA